MDYEFVKFERSEKHAVTFVHLDVPGSRLTPSIYRSLRRSAEDYRVHGQHDVWASFEPGENTETAIRIAGKCGFRYLHTLMRPRRDIYRLTPDA